jgi:hypothetical protein
VIAEGFSHVLAAIHLSSTTGRVGSRGSDSPLPPANSGPVVWRWRGRPSFHFAHARWFMPAVCTVWAEGITTCWRSTTSRRWRRRKAY